MTRGDPLPTLMSPADNCRYCWMCRHVCPVGHVTKRETLTPHGWALMIASVERGVLTWNAETVDALYKCADCGMCRSHCVTEQPLPNIIAAARAKIVESGIAPPIVSDIDERLRRWGNPYAPNEPSVFQRFSPTLGRLSSTGASKVALFVGDTAAHLNSGPAAAALTLLASAGVEPALVGVGRSTGLLASSLGLVDTAIALGRAVLDEIVVLGCRELLVLGPGDRYAFERLYSERLNLAWPTGVVVKEVTSVLADALTSGRLRFKRYPNAPPYAYHDPCHAPRLGSGAAASRALLTTVLGDAAARQLFWRDGRAHPCGAIGGLEFTQPQIAAQLAEARFADATAAGASWFISEDPTCLHHLRRCRTSGPTIVSMYELLADHQD